MEPIGLAFLQNMWVRNPDAVRKSIERFGDEFRRALIKRLLFSGCLTGRRIQVAFGENLLSKMVWDEATTEIAGDSKTICHPEPDHILTTIEHYKPVVIVTFGAVAGNAVTALWRGKLIRAPHPAARQSDTMARLRMSAVEFEEIANSFGFSNGAYRGQGHDPS